MKGTGLIKTKFKLGVRNQNPARSGVFASVAIQGQANRPDLLSQRLANPMHHLRKGNVLVMCPEIGFGRGRKNGFGEALGLLQTGWQFDPTNGTIRLIIFPARPDQITPHDRFNRYRLQSLDHHCTACDLCVFVRRDDRFGRHTG